MTDWLQRYQETQEKALSPLAEWLNKAFPTEAQKGGPGSGHHGHAGRPGQRGGSLPGRSGGGQAVQSEEEGVAYSDLTEEERRALSELGYARQRQAEALAGVINPLQEQINRNSPRAWRRRANAAERQADDWESGFRPSKRLLKLAKEKRKDAARFRRWADDLARQWQDKDNTETIKAREAMRRASRDLRKLKGMYAEAKKFPRPIEARRLVQNSAQKGGEGSGHWGHAGRPGIRGGSAPGKMGGRGRVNRDYFTKGPGRHIIAGLTEAEQQGVIAQLTGARIQARHIAGLNAIKNSVPEDTDKWDWHDDWSYTDLETDDVVEVEGVYSHSARNIHIKSEWLTEDTSVRMQAGQSWRSEASHILGHELGHHVTWHSQWYEQTGRRLDDALNTMVQKGKDGKLKRSRLWSAGLRPYSLTTRSELKADVWKVYQFGGKTQRKTLAQILGVKSLEAIFED